MIECPDCDKFSKRQRALCLGVADEGRPTPLLKDVLNFRAQNSVRCDNAPTAAPVHGNLLNSSAAPLDRTRTIVIPHRPASVPIFDGPGTILKSIFADLGQNYQNDSTCQCTETANLMDSLGPEGCEQHEAMLIERLTASAAKLSTLDTVALAWKGLFGGYFFDLSAAGLLRLAIRRSKEARQRATDERKASEPMTTPAVSTKRWSYGITTTPHRLDTLLPQTIRSLAAAGFDQPLLGVDRCTDCKAYERFGLPFSARTSHNHNHANWFLTAHEVFYRDPFADFYAIFEDDLVISRNAKAYLEATMVEPKGYYSLFTNPANHARTQRGQVGWFMSNQRGEGAVGLVFSKDAFLHLLGNVGTLLHARQIVNPRDGKLHKNLRGEETPHGKEYVDGLIVSAMAQRGYVEWCHTPSIVQHVGHDSSAAHVRFPDAPVFRGEAFDLMELVKG